MKYKINRVIDSLQASSNVFHSISVTDASTVLSLDKTPCGVTQDICLSITTERFTVIWQLNLCMDRNDRGLKTLQLSELEKFSVQCFGPYSPSCCMEVRHLRLESHRSSTMIFAISGGIVTMKTPNP